jgi:hypothetical protein
MYCFGKKMSIPSFSIALYTCTLYCKIAKGKEVFSIEDKGKITLN